MKASIFFLPLFPETIHSLQTIKEKKKKRSGYTNKNSSKK
jgi:hypothetical protein